MLALLATVALAAVPAPSYEQRLVHEQLQTINKEMDLADFTHEPAQKKEHLEKSVTMSRAFQRVVVQSAAIERIECIALQQLGRLDEALESCSAATQLPLHGLAAWSPLFQLSTLQEQMKDNEAAMISLIESIERMDESKTEIEWMQLGNVRLARFAARASDSHLLETSLKAALKSGFSLDEISCDPEWQHLYQLEGNRRVLDKLLLVYSEPRSLERIRGSVECQ